MKQCKECRDGEHDNIDEEVYKCKVIDPDTNKTKCICYLCGAHRHTNRSDGYEVKVNEF